MKFVLYGVIVFSCSYIGVVIKNNYYSVYKIFDGLVSLSGRLKTEIGFFKTKLNELLKKEQVCNNAEIKVIVSNYFLDCESFDSKFTKLKKTLADYGLNDFHINHISSFFSDLGKTDSVSQCEIIDRYSIVFNDYLLKAKEKYLKFGKLSFWLALICGVALVIILI